MIAMEQEEDIKKMIEQQYKDYIKSNNADVNENKYSAVEEASNLKYASEYSDDGLWSKITKHYKVAGEKIIQIAISMYYSLRDDKTPKWAKSIIIGALGYFILPIDIIPDFVPIAGFTDDFATISVALAAIAMYITDEHKEKAKQFVVKLFRK
jgi:uncharacterized membrane protein YkvA (DUF1232 family)